MGKKLIIFSIALLAVLAITLLFETKGDSQLFLNKHKKTYYPLDNTCSQACEAAKGKNCGVAQINCCDPNSCVEKSFLGHVYSGVCSKYIHVDNCTD